MDTLGSLLRDGTPQVRLNAAKTILKMAGADRPSYPGLTEAEEIEKQRKHEELFKIG